MRKRSGTPKAISSASRPELIQTLRLILEREQEWLAAMEAQPQPELKSLLTYLSEHLSLLSDSMEALSKNRYVSLTSTDPAVVEGVNANLANYVAFALASHHRACTNFNSGLAARGITTITLGPIVLP